MSVIRNFYLQSKFFLFLILVDSVWKVKLVSSNCFQELLSLIGSGLSEKIFNIIVLLISSGILSAY